jgi:thiamine biosynthesis lipoprotein
MGCDAHLLLVDPSPTAMTAAVEHLHDLDRRWSRFRHDSELSVLNTAQGDWVQVSVATMVLVTTMQRASADTAAWFDPTFLFEVLETGYVQSTDDPRRQSVVVDLPCPGMSIDDAEIDTSRSRIRLPDGLAIDAGGIGKGLAADLTVEMLLTGGTAGALVSIGGDMTAAGRAPEESGWTIDVEHPLEPGTTSTRLTLSGGGVATSSTRKRRSVSNGVSRHHTIDPRTRQSAATDLASVTVVAPTGWQAEAHATALLLNGSALAEAYAAERSLSGLAMSNDGSEVRFGSLASHPTALTEAVR